MVLRKNGKPGSNVAGTVGDIYIDTNTGEKYECIFAYKDSMLNEMYKWKLVGKEDLQNREETAKEVKPDVDISNVSEEQVEEPILESPEPMVEEPVSKNHTNYHKHYKHK